MGSYRVILFLKEMNTPNDYVFKTNEHTHRIRFYNLIENRVCIDKNIYILITNQNSCDCKNNENEYNINTIIIIDNGSSCPIHEQNIKKCYPNVQHIRHLRDINISEKNIKQIVEAEILKINNDTRNITFKDFWNKDKFLFFALPIFFIIIFYCILRPYFPEELSITKVLLYNPNYKTDAATDIKIVLMAYTAVNIIVYWKYILTVFNNINNSFFEAKKLSKKPSRSCIKNIKRVLSKYRKQIHVILQSSIICSFFASAFIIFKSFFITISGFRINSANNFININNILNQYLPYFKEEYLIYAFLILDILLLCMVYNYKCNNKVQKAIIPENQQSILKSAKINFQWSIAANILIIIGVFFLVRPLYPDDLDNSAINLALFLLQGFYLLASFFILSNDLQHR